VIPPDNEIFEVEQRIAGRRAQLARHSREAGRRALQALASPMALIGAAAIGFFVAGGIARRRQEPPHPERRKSDHTKAAKATGLAGVLVPAAMWFVRAQWGSPVKLAQVMLEKFQRGKPAVSPRGDMTRP
jgi:hypothetical protein